MQIFGDKPHESVWAGGLTTATVSTLITIQIHCSNQSDVIDQIMSCVPSIANTYRNTMYGYSPQKSQPH